MKHQKVIKTKSAYNKAIVRTIAIFNAEEGTPESDELDLLLVLVKEYEDKHMVLPSIDFIEAELTQLANEPAEKDSMSLPEFNRLIEQCRGQS